MFLLAHNGGRQMMLSLQSCNISMLLSNPTLQNSTARFDHPIQHEKGERKKQMLTRIMSAS